MGELDKTQQINIQNGINFDNTDSTVKDVWTPVTGKRAYVADVIISLMNKQASSYIIVAVQIYIGGSWRTLAPIAAGSQSADKFVHNFDGRIRSAVSSGSARIRVAKSGTSTNWEAQIVVTGQEK